MPQSFLILARSISTAIQRSASSVVSHANQGVGTLGGSGVKCGVSKYQITQARLMLTHAQTISSVNNNGPICGTQTVEISNSSSSSSSQLALKIIDSVKDND